MLRHLGLALLITGCVSGGHLAGGKLYETKAVAHLAWNAMQGSWPALPARTQGLAIAPHSRWGEVAQIWSDGRTYSHLFRSDTRGPYSILGTDGLPARIGDAPAVVLELDFDKANQPGEVLRPAAMRIVTAAKPERALDDAVARWKRHLTDHAAEIERALEATNRASDGRPLSTETTATQDGFTPTWMPDDQRFVIVFARTIRRTSSLSETFKTTPCGKYRNILPGAMGFPDERPVQVACPQLPPTTTVTHTRSYAVDVALVLEYDADGTRTYERWYDPDPRPAKGPF